MNIKTVKLEKDLNLSVKDEKWHKLGTAGDQSVRL